MDWTDVSPDLNTIEQCLYFVVRRFRERKQPPQPPPELVHVLAEGWETMPQLSDRKQDPIM